ncbi:hypothetical protein [Caproiciproducens sp.]
MPTILEQLQSKNIGSLQTSSNQSFADILKREVERLKQCIDDQISIFYMSYSPKVYKRTYKFERALFVDDFLDISTNGTKITIKMRLRFNDALSYSPSLWHGSDAYLPLILDRGWAWKNQPNNPIDRFSKFSGAHFIEKGIEQFNQDNPLGIKINIQTY